MAALDILVVVRIVLRGRMIQQLSHHFPCVARMDTVVLSGSDEQSRRISAVVGYIVVGRVLVEEIVPVAGRRVAVLTHPACSRQQLAVALHVQQRHLANNRPKQLSFVTGQHVAHKEAAVGAALDPEQRTGRYAAAQQVFGHSFEVLVRLVAVHLFRRLVPPWAVFASAADVRINPNAAMLKPSNASCSRVRRCQRYLEAAVAVQ
mmetsp:Transcript_20320/g.38228  ORF Transcript_20320/g.38228 Transcript_20320/m.38228 type:complete len:205 (-) Transcript_20320:264-878(-)